MAVDVVICNLTRFGDLVQTQPLLDDLHMAGLSAGLICLDNFAPAVALLRNVNALWPLRGGALMAKLERSWPLACGEILEFARLVRDESNARFVLNLTPTLPARLLARLLAASGARIMGFGLDDYGYALNGGVWASFISVAARQRVNAPFNVSDMLRKMAAPLTGNISGDFRLASPPEAAAAWAKNFLRDVRKRYSPAGFMAFQPGASAPARCWPVESFRALGQQLWDAARLVPVILGTGAESGLAREYAAGCGHPFVDATGKTDLFQLCALLRETRFLVSNDTGTMHVAVGQNVPVLAIFLATAQPWDTGPLMPGCCCLEPALPCHPCSFGQHCPHGNICAQAISAQSAASLILGWLETGSWQSGLNEKTASECRVWLTEKKEDGLSGIRLLGAAPEERNLWMRLLRNFWSHLLDALENGREKQNFPAQWSSLAIPPGIAKETIPVLEQAGVILDSIQACGSLAIKSVQARQLLLKNCQRLQTVLEACKPLDTLGEFWREFTRNQFEDLENFLPATLVMASHIRQFAEFLQNNSACGT